MTKRTIRIEGDVAYVPLTQGYEAVVDATDVPMVEGWNWTARVGKRAGKPVWVYAIRAEYRDGKQTIVRMHRIIADVPDGMVADHMDGDGLNNRRSNLRIATPAENAMNKRFSGNAASGAKGVYWHKRAKKWQAQIGIGWKRKSLGIFETVEEASAAYAAASAQLHGEFGRAC